MVILHFGVRIVVFEQKYFHLSKQTVFKRNNSDRVNKIFSKNLS